VAPLVPVIGGGMRRRKLLVALTGLAAVSALTSHGFPHDLAAERQRRLSSRIRER
jgi:hypothetical protein